MDVNDMEDYPTSKGLHIHDDPTYYDITSSNVEDYEWERKKEIMENVVNLMKVKTPNVEMSVKRAVKRTMSESKSHWLDAVEKAKVAEDPWKEFNIENERTERAIRFRYNALHKKWVQDNIEVKMQNESFARGAMRKCYRMKKLSKIVHQHEWNYATNIVAKVYIEDVLPKVYIDDVKLQMDAKLWAEEYNRHKPPKKVDIVQIGCIKLIDREDTPMYHIEHFVEGDYVKYNSNSGFVLSQDKLVRATPQAFSHFSFERSGHQMIVVDIQGVGDLYTDPQIHTANGSDYGEANLGTKGMALFFASHRCLNICHDLDLHPFDLSDPENERVNGATSANSTASVASTEIKSRSLSESHRITPNLELVNRIRSLDSGSSMSPTDYSSFDGSVDDVFYEVPRRRMLSELDSGISSEEETSSHAEYFQNQEKKCSNINDIPELTDECIRKRLEELAHLDGEQDTILGQIHYDLAIYNYVGRFTDTEPDYKSAFFHLEKAALDGNVEANKILAFKYFNLKTDALEELELEENHDKGMYHLLSAASWGDKECLLKAAKAYETGENLGLQRKKSYKEALKFYEAALNDSECGSHHSFPVHQIQASMAEIWRSGGHGIEKDPGYAGELYSSAAESAMSIGKGKLSNKYFMLAEEAWEEVEED